MILIVSDTSPLHYLTLIGEIQILPSLYDAAIGGLCKLDEVFDKLKQTNFRATDDLYQQFLDAYENSGK